MLSRVEVVTYRGTLLSLPLEDVDNGYVVKDIEGLHPVKATLVSSSFANQDGSQYHSSRREARNVKLKIGFEPDYVYTSVKDLRDRLYSFMMPKSEVMLRFIDSGGLEVEIIGIVESNEAPIFTKDPVADISIMCFLPDFLVPNAVREPGMSTETNNVLEIEYPGTVETGIVFTLSLNRDESAFTIYHTLPGGSLRQMDFAAPLLSGDTVTISTVSRDKWAVLKRTNVESSILYGITPQSSWIELKQGTNQIRVYATGTPIPYTIDYVTRYGGL